ncbi:MAG: hypothetical protein R3359_09290, partial [Marinirhabdus sp.]|nr:hypothetical protein [Marinirhabdus sp.]
AFEALPENYKVSNDLLDVEVSYKQQDGVLAYTKQINFKERLIESDRFEEWDELFDRLKETTDQQIILIKQ